MKTLKQAREEKILEYIDNMPNDVYEKIQRDAREGTVAEEEYAILLRVAAHTHVNNQKDDICAKCGLDLRHPIHHRFPRGG